MNSKKRMFLVFMLVALVPLLIAQCAPQATPAAVEEPAAAEPAAPRLSLPPLNPLRKSLLPP